MEGNATIVTWSSLTSLMTDFPSNQTHMYDVAFQHLSGQRPFAFSMDQLFTFYGNIIANPSVFTIVREPISHALSWIAYMKLPQTIDEVNSMIQGHELPNNLLCIDFGLSTASDVHQFLTRDMSRFSLVCIAEQFDECLVMMKRKFGWSMLDITYLRLLDASNSMSVVSRIFFEAFQRTYDNGNGPT